MAMKMKNTDRKLQAWIDARTWDEPGEARQTRQPSSTVIYIEATSTR
jgi:hypothetical protein